MKLIISEVKFKIKNYNINPINASKDFENYPNFFDYLYIQINLDPDPFHILVDIRKEIDKHLKESNDKNMS